MNSAPLMRSTPSWIILPSCSPAAMELGLPLVPVECCHNCQCSKNLRQHTSHRSTTRSSTAPCLESNAAVQLLLQGTARRKYKKAGRRRLQCGSCSEVLHEGNKKTGRRIGSRVSCAYMGTQWLICQLLVDREVEWKIIGD